MQFATIIREGPEVSVADDGRVFQGHYYIISKQWKEFDEKDENPINVWEEKETWIIYPDGIFEYHVDKDKEQMHEICPGLFDRFRYNAFVEMMKNFKTEWMAELEYDEDNRKTELDG